MNAQRPTLILTLVAAALTTAGCGDDSSPTSGGGNGFPGAGTCVIEGFLLSFGGVARDGIPALSNPTMVAAGDGGAAYLNGTDRVIGMEWDGEWIAVPLNVGWWHEIVNLDGNQARVAVTYCPLTGTSIVFDRSALNGAELGVSGLLYRNNLVMFDRSRDASLWPQLLGQGNCGVSQGTKLAEVPVIEMTWAGWLELHPTTSVVSSQTGFDRNYQGPANPYRDYERLDAPPLFPDGEDPRRLPKERVLGLPDGQGGGLAVPFLVLSRTPAAALTVEVAGTTSLVLWDRSKQAAMAFDPEPVWAPGVEVGPGPVVFRAEGTRLIDDATGSVWSVDGRAIEGPAVGSTLTPVGGALVAFWFAWAAFHPNTDVLDTLP